MKTDREAAEAIEILLEWMQPKEYIEILVDTDEDRLVKGRLQASGLITIFRDMLRWLRKDEGKVACKGVSYKDRA